MNIRLFQVSFILVWFSVKTTADANPDEVSTLPGLSFPVNFRQFSGYLESINDVSLHYWLYESQNDPLKDPVVFWFNGGPGCSSLLGALTEQGPFRINSQQQLELNDFAWNQRANMIFLESPAGVGYSIQKDRNYTSSDDLTAEINFAAIKSFFKKYPHLAENDFFITGESYAGVYIPTLSVLCLKNKFPKNFKSIAIGNPSLEDRDIISIFHYFYHHSFINDDDWKNLHSNCNCSIDYRQCDYLEQMKKFENCRNFIKSLDLGKYFSLNIYIDALIPSESSSLSSSSSSSSIMKQFNDWILDPTEEKWMIASKKLYEKNYKNFYRKRYPNRTNENIMENWLNRQDVRNALNIDSKKVENWSVCQDIDYKVQYHSMKPQIRYLLDNGLKILFYHGDFDVVCNYLGGRWFIEDLGYNATSKYQPWYYEKRLAGFQINYGNLTYKTVFASGHLVPTDQPGPSLKLFHDFLSG